MPDNLSMNDPRDIWQNQTTEAFKMSADQLRRKMERWRWRARAGVLLSIVIGFGLSTAFALRFARTHETAPRLGLVVLILWCLYFAYQSFHWTWPRRLPPDPAVNTSLEFYRSQLEKRRDYNRHIWRRAGLTFCFLGLALFLTPALIQAFGAPRLFGKMMPFFALLAIWIVLFRFMGRRTRRKLQAEIDELRAFEADERL